MNSQEDAVYYEQKYYELKMAHKNYEIRTAITGNRIDILAVPFSNDDAITAHINADKIDDFIEAIDALFYTIEDIMILREKPDSELFYYIGENE